MRIRISPAAVVGTTALVVAMSGTAVAASGGGFVLGHINKTTSNTVINNSKGTALVLAAKKGIAPFGVNGNKVKVPSLNADELDGLDSLALQRRVTGQCGATGISAVSATGSVTCETAHHLFFTSGTGSFTVPAGVTQIEITARGGGGSGGDGGAATFGRGGGGGQGGVSTTLVSVSAGQLYTVNVGAGAAAPTAGAPDGLAGGRTTVIVNPSADATKFAAVANGGAGGAHGKLCSATTGAQGGNGGGAPGPSGVGALGLTMQNGFDGTDAGTDASTDGCTSGGIGAAAGYAGAGGDGGLPAATPGLGHAGTGGLVEVTLIS